MTLYLSRLQLACQPAKGALDQLLNLDDAPRLMDAHHRLLWSVFSDGADRRRDFLWRMVKKGEFLTLSARPPAANDLFKTYDIKDIKPFTPKIAAGDHLAFILRANATKIGRNHKNEKIRVDVVMDALKAIPAGERAARRFDIARNAGRDWLVQKGEKAGFSVIRSKVELQDYSVVALPIEGRKKRTGQPQFGILDLTGVVKIDDPEIFCMNLAQGFGRAKAFGCGLMLIRRCNEF